MLLHGRQGTELEVNLVGYQFPDERLDPWDSNSLLVAVRVIAPQGGWEVVDPCLTTWEADHLVRWLALLALRADVLTAQLTEPNVTFTARPGRDPGRLDVRACFALELRPPWVKAAAGSGNLCVDLDVGRDDLGRAAADLQADLTRFPQRGDDPTL